MFVVLAFFWSTFLMWKVILLTSMKEEKVFDVVLLSLLGSVVIGRFVHVVTHFESFGLNIWKILLINGYPGISLFGVVFGGLILGYVIAHAHKLDFFTLIDYLVSPIFLALAIGKMGSFFSGAEVGAITTFPISIKYANMEGLRHLTPLYESLLFFIATFVTYQLIFQVRKQKLHKGFTIHVLLLFFSLVYVVFEPLRTHSAPLTHWFQLDIFAIISAVVLLTELIYLVYYGRKSIVTVFSFNNSKHTNGITISSIFSRRAKKEAHGGESENSETG